MLSLALSFSCVAASPAATEKKSAEHTPVNEQRESADGLWKTSYVNAVIRISDSTERKPSLRVHWLDPADKKIHDRFVAAVRKKNIAKGIVYDETAFFNEILKKVNVKGTTRTTWKGKMEVEILGINTRINLTVSKIDENTLEIKTSKYIILSHQETWTRVSPDSAQNAAAR